MVIDIYKLIICYVFVVFFFVELLFGVRYRCVLLFIDYILRIFRLIYYGIGVVCGKVGLWCDYVKNLEWIRLMFWFLLFLRVEDSWML